MEYPNVILHTCMNYTGMERDVRKLAQKEKLAQPSNLAVMTTGEVCDLVQKSYTVVNYEDECIVLVKNSDMEEYEAAVRTLNKYRVFLQR